VLDTFEANEATVVPAVGGPTSGDVVLELEPGGRCLRALGAQELLPMRPEDVVGRTIGDVLPVEIAATAMRALEQVRGDGRPRLFEYTRPRADGAHCFEARMSPAGNGNVLVVIRNVDDRRVVEQELHETEARFRLMADHAPVMLWMAGVDSECSYFNEGWLEFAGRPMERELGVGWAERIHFEDLQGCLHVYLSSFVVRQSFRTEYRLRRADGEYRWILDTGVPRYEPDGRFAGFIGSCIDISELRAAREQLQQTSRDLEVRVKERTEELERRVKENEILVREVHHRVKNNLQLVSSLLNMQGRHFKEGRLRQALEECQGRVQTIALIHQRLYQSRDLAHVPFAQYARGLAESVFRASDLTAAAIALEMEIDDVSLSVERAIPCGLILNELLTNALKHAFPDGRRGVVRVELRRRRPERLLLVVADDGVGLPRSIDARDNGSLGLELVRTLAEQLDGDLQIEERSGTAFRLEFESGA
jgi:PAS domain S-box-containing protein